MLGKLRRHLHFIVVTAVLTIVMTFPTIVYTFRSDVRWLPNTNYNDVLKELWGVWYGKQVLTGQADRFHTNLIFYPEGVSLTYLPLFFPFIIAVNALQVALPVFNAYSLFFMISIFSSALAAYLYLLYLFINKWLALFGAVIFAFCPQVLGSPSWPAIAWIAPMPVILYCAHRGIKEKRLVLIVLGGLFAGLTTAVTMYFFVCVLIALGLLMCGLGASRWRDKIFWRHAVLLFTVLLLSCAWRVIPMMQNRDALERSHDYANTVQHQGDLVSFIINRQNPITGHIARELLQTPSDTKILKGVYLGFLPLVLIGIGLLNKGARRKMLPWLGLLLVFLVLCLGPTLSINGTMFESIRLPKYYLNQLLPFVFAAFYQTQFFMAGAWLPLAVLACFGLMALRERFPIVARPGFVLLLILIVAVEKFDPVKDALDSAWIELVSDERHAYLDWLAQESEDEIALINVPFGWNNAHFYIYAQTLSGYPQTEGAISRRPGNRYDFIISNHILSSWHSYRPIHCETAERDAYMAALEALDTVGFSHIVFHRVYSGAAHIEESFDGIPAAYSDGYVSIYRLEDLRASCPKELGARHFFAAAYADALAQNTTLRERHGAAVVLAPTSRIADHFIRFLRHNDQAVRQIVALSSDEAGNITIQGTASVDLEAQNAVWLVQDRRDFVPERTEENYAWLLERFRFCQRFHEDEDKTTDLYLRREIPCAAMSEQSALDVRYDSGVRLHNASFTVEPNLVRFYFAWTEQTEGRYAFSIQFFDQAGQKALQYDHPIWSDLLAIHEIDTTTLSAGVYSVKLIVYDFETQISQSGALMATTEGFERELELATIEI